MEYRVDFESMPWEPVMEGVRHKRYRNGDQVLRLVEYSASMPVHDCERGHMGHLVEGIMEIDLPGGSVTFRSGDVVCIPAGPDHRHRARVLTERVLALFVEDA